MSFQISPPPAGWYVVGSRGSRHLRVELGAKPRWWHRTWTRVFLGWAWEDAP